METRSKKRKQSLIPPNPYQRTFTKRRQTLLSLNRSSSTSSSASSAVKDLRARRVFSPVPSSHAKGSIGSAEGNQKEVLFDVGLAQNDKRAVEITQIDEKETVFDAGVDEKDPKLKENSEIEIGGLSVDDKLKQEKEVSKDPKVCEKYVSVIEGERDGQIKPKLKSGSLVPCLRRKVYKNPASFSYKRMLPFLMDLAKDDTNAPKIHQCQKVDKSVEEMPPATTQEILVNTNEKDVLTDMHPVDDLHACPTAPIDDKCSNTEFPQDHILEPTTPESPETLIPCTVSNFVIRDLPRLFGEIASQSPKDTPHRLSNSNETPHFVHEKSPPTEASFSVVIPELLFIKEDNGVDKEHLKTNRNMESGSCEGEGIQSTPPDGDAFCKVVHKEHPKTNGNTESESCEGKGIQSTPPDGDAFCKVGPGTSKDCAPESHLNNKSVDERTRCMGENEKTRHPNSEEIGSHEGKWMQSTPPDGNASCKVERGTSKGCAMVSPIKGKSDLEISRCMGENEKDSRPHSVEIGSYEGEWLQSTPPDGDAFCKLGPGTSKDCALDVQLNNKGDHEKNRCLNGDEKDRHPNSKAKLGILFPSSRMRLYKAPGSFSYRRLLPYLMDLSRKDTNMLGTPPCKIIDKTVDDRPPSPMASQDRHVRELSKQTLSNGHPLSDRDVSPLTETAEMTSTTSSSNVDCISLESHEDPPVQFATPNPVLRSAVQEPAGNSIVLEVNSSMVIKPSPVHVEGAPQIQHDTVNESNHVKPTHDVTFTIPDSNLLIKSSPFLVSPEPSLLKEGSTGPYLLPGEVQDDGTLLVQKTNTYSKSSGQLSLIHEQSSIELSPTPITSSSGSSMGILKKYPLGCRGICTCLNCASFRLHAERAFEFSRNQLQDTEEVATELMKELSGVRALLGKITDGVESRVDFQVPEVKEVCTKALRTEEWAKRQLEQMHQELNVRCRIPGLPRPKVRFADNSQMQMSTSGNTSEKIPVE